MNIVCFGAHPDDCEFFAGGTCVKWAQTGHRVLLVSFTNGDAGHFSEAGGVLGRRRTREAEVSAERAGCQALVLGCHDGELMPTMDARKAAVKIIREWRADIVLSHRTNDYHPDHRYAAQIVQDAAFMVTVPNFCPEVERLERNPVFLYLMDSFKKPCPFHPDIAVDVDDVMNIKWSMLDAMESQVYEWLPWLDGGIDKVPPARDGKARRAWLEKKYKPFFEAPANTGREALTRWYGAAHAKKTRFAELFEVCEYGNRPSKEEISRLFPFFPEKKR